MNRLHNAIEQRLRTLLAPQPVEDLREAMTYSVLAGGKRIRPMLLLAACEAVSGSADTDALDFACAVEFIHTYSLIHDDLPCMDDDALRRGLPACHIRFGEAMAVLAGDALLNLAYEVMACVCAQRRSGRYARAMAAVASGAGACGMVAGQVLDIRNEGRLVDAKTLSDIHSFKTGALIEACCTAGALLGGASPVHQARFSQLGQWLGLAFQIKDDLLDATAVSGHLGKPAGSDIKNKKNTYVTVHGLTESAETYRCLAEKIQAQTAGLPRRTAAFNTLVEKTLERDH